MSLQLVVIVSGPHAGATIAVDVAYGEVPPRITVEDVTYAHIEDSMCYRYIGEEEARGRRPVPRVRGSIAVAPDLPAMPEGRVRSADPVQGEQWRPS